MNPLKSDNKLVTYHSWFACPLLDLQVDSRTRVRNGGGPLTPPRHLHLDLPKHVMRNVSRSCLQAHTLAVESSSGAVELATVTSLPVLLFKMRCTFFSTVKTRLCALSESTRSFSSLSANPFLRRPRICYMPCLVRLYLIFFLNGTTNSAISFRKLWTLFGWRRPATNQSA